MKAPLYTAAAALMLAIVSAGPLGLPGCHFLSLLDMMTTHDEALIDGGDKVKDINFAPGVTWKLHPLGSNETVVANNADNARALIRQYSPNAKEVKNILTRIVEMRKGRVATGSTIASSHGNYTVWSDFTFSEKCKIRFVKTSIHRGSSDAVQNT